MKYTQLLMDKSKEELAMLCMDKHRQIKRLTEENARLREELDAIAQHNAGADL